MFLRLAKGRLHEQKMKHRLPSRMNRARHRHTKHTVRRVTFPTNACFSSGTKESSFPELPPVTKVRSAGMMGSLRRFTLMLFAVPYTVKTTPNSNVAIQKRLVMKMKTR